MPLILPGNVASATAAAYDVDNSCRFDGSSAYHQKTFVAGTSQRIFSISTWIKRSALGDAGAIWSGYYDGSNYITLAFKDDDTLRFQQAAGGVTMNYVTNRVFRDPSAWMHILAIVDTTDGTAGDRQQIWINGVRETSFGTSTNFDQNDDAEIGATDKVNIVGRDGGDDDYFDGYMAEHVFIDGTAYAATSFGEFNSDSPTIWQPIDVSGLTFGNNGYYLDFKASDNLGNDANGGTDLTESGLAAIDQTTDTPTNNFATYNPLDHYYNTTTSTGGTLTEGNTKFVIASGNKGFARSTIGVTTGKWYWENKLHDISKGFHGICNIGLLVHDSTPQVNAVFLYEATPDFRSGAQILTTGVASISDDDIMNFALDMDNNAFYMGVNNTWMNSGDPTSGSSRTGAISELFTTGRAIISDSGDVFASLLNTSTTGGINTSVNFGNPAYANSSNAADADGYGAFEFAPPSGYFALCTKNLAEYG